MAKEWTAEKIKALQKQVANGFLKFFVWKL